MKKIRYFSLMLVLLIGIFLTGFSSAVCCEKVTDGAWCMDDDLANCDNSYNAEPTACISTSYCALGTCINKKDGECIPNTPKRTCDKQEFGFWDQREPSEISQCQTGCCFVGDQAAFVTQTKCKNFASLYGIETHFQTNIQDEISCIANAFSDVEGACVYERDFETTCKRLTKKECQDLEESLDAVFHEGFLCTADELATNCAPTDKTTCREEYDEVFFLDSCENIANVYDSSMITKEGGNTVANGPVGAAYWERITSPTCGAGSNSGSTTCGDCNYYDGSTCKKYDRSQDTGGRPVYGDNICRSLNCQFDNDRDGTKETYLHGESWCGNSPGTDLIDVTGGLISKTRIDSIQFNVPGSRYYRLVCYNGEVTVEPCADRRAEVCVQGSIVNERVIAEGAGTFESAICRVNKWQDCFAQPSQSACEDLETRDCQWVGGKCAPLFSPGSNFWGGETEETEEENDICNLASTTCNAVATKKGGALGDIAGEKWEIDNEEGKKCFGINELTGTMMYQKNWGTDQNQICVSLGDCQGKVTEQSQTMTKLLNYLGFN